MSEGNEETIKDRIERETREGLDAGRGKRTVDFGVDPLGAPMPQRLRGDDFVLESEDVRFDARWIYHASGSPAAIEILKNGEPWYQLAIPVLPNEPAMEAPTPPPGPWTTKAIEDVTKVLGARGHSYTVEQEFENFFEQAKMADTTLRQVFRGALGQKLTREKATYQRLVEMEEKGAIDGEDSGAYYELYLQWLDSIRDVCGYGLLFFGWGKAQFDQVALES